MGKHTDDIAGSALERATEVTVFAEELKMNDSVVLF